MRMFIFAVAAILALSACESDIDTCLTNETAAAENALKKANPVYQAYSSMEAFDNRLEDYYRALHTKRIKHDSGPDAKCDMAPNSDCTQALEEQYETLGAHIEQAGFADVDAAINALWEVQEKHANPEDLEKVMTAGDAVTGTTPSEDDVEGWVKHELAAYRAERDYHLNKIILPNVAAAAAQQASDLCGSAGL
jgi:hypothetical protein